MSQQEFQDKLKEFKDKLKEFQDKLLNLNPQQSQMPNLQTLWSQIFPVNYTSTPPAHELAQIFQNKQVSQGSSVAVCIQSIGSFKYGASGGCGQQRWNKGKSRCQDV